MDNYKIQYKEPVRFSVAPDGKTQETSKREKNVLQDGKEKQSGWFDIAEMLARVGIAILQIGFLIGILALFSKNGQEVLSHLFHTTKGSDFAFFKLGFTFIATILCYGFKTPTSHVLRAILFIWASYDVYLNFNEDILKGLFLPFAIVQKIILLTIFAPVIGVIAGSFIVNMFNPTQIKEK